MQYRTHGLRRTGALIVFLGLVGPFAGLASADDPGLTVQSRDLDLSRFADIEVLYGRIRTAAHSVCRAEKAVWDGKALLHARRCAAQAVEDAIAQADQPLLTTVHRSFQQRLAQR
jgi:UrcA family protein